MIKIGFSCTPKGGKTYKGKMLVYLPYKSMDIEAPSMPQHIIDDIKEELYSLTVNSVMCTIDPLTPDAAAQKFINSWFITRKETVVSNKTNKEYTIEFITKEEAAEPKLLHFHYYPIENRKEVSNGVLKLENPNKMYTDEFHVSIDWTDAKKDIPKVVIEQVLKVFKGTESGVHTVRDNTTHERFMVIYDN